MVYLRPFAKYIFRSNRNMDPKTAQKYMDISRMAYFFSVSTLAVVYYNIVKDGPKTSPKEEEEEDLLLLGKPVIEDKSPAFKKMRESGVAAGILYQHSKEGLQKIEYNREEYLQELEKAAFEKARDAQRKALAEGKELPPTAIRLV